MVVFSEYVSEDGSSFELKIDPFSFWSGALTRRGELQKHAPPWVKEQIREWLFIQYERQRIGLPFLKQDQMEPIRRSYH